MSDDTRQSAERPVEEAELEGHRMARPESFQDREDDGTPDAGEGPEVEGHRLTKPERWAGEVDRAS
jgi:hypothetical protein